MSIQAITAAALASPFGLILSSPLALLSLLVIPVIVILHSLSLRWKDVEVSSLVFWEAVVKEKKSSLRLKSIMRSLILLAQILAAALLAFALSTPLLARASLSGSGNVILVLDQTASMKTREGLRTRFDEARQKALDLLPALRGGSRMAVIGAGYSPTLLVPFTDDRNRLRRGLQAAEATDESGSMRDSVMFALTLRDPTKDDRVVIITDGAFDTMGDLDDAQPWISLIRVGESTRNVGITAMALRRSVEEDGGYQMFVDVHNFWDKPMSFPFTVSAGGVQIFKEDVTLEAGEERGFSMPYTGPLPGSAARTGGGAARAQPAGNPDQAGRVTAEIGVSDDLSADNKAYAVISPALGVSSLVVGQGNWFLTNALSVLPNVSVSLLKPTEGLPPDPAPADDEVVIYDGGTVPELDRGNYILIGAIPPNLSLKATGTLSRPEVTSWNAAHPLLSGASLQTISIGQALRVEGKGWVPLLSSGAYPLIMAYQREDLKVIFIAFTLDGSDLPLRPGFPIFLANALGWFFPGWLSAQAEQVEAGAAAVILPSQLRAPAPVSGAGSGVRAGAAGVSGAGSGAQAGTAGDGAGQAQGGAAGAGTRADAQAAPIIVQRPDGVREVLPVEGSSLILRDTSRVGFYTVSEPGVKSVTVAVSLSSPQESDVSPRYAFSPLSTEGGRDQKVASGISLTPLWIALAIAAVALILAEWLLAVREKR